MDSDVAAVSQEGVITGINKGSTYILARFESGLIAYVNTTVRRITKIELYEELPAVIDEDGDYAYFSFVPEKSGDYEFYSIDGYDTYGHIYDESLNAIEDYTQYDENYNFRVGCELEAGKQYYLGAAWYQNSGSFNVTISNYPYDMRHVNLGILVGEQASVDLSYFSDTETLSSWESMDPDIVSVSQDGVITGISLGRTEVYAHFESGLTVIVTVTVRQITSIEPDNTVSAEIMYGGEYVYFSFVPAKSGPFTFYSTGGDDTYGYLYDENFNILESDDDSGDMVNFKIDYSFLEGVQYYFGVRYYSSSYTGTFDVTLEEKEIKTSGQSDDDLFWNYEEGTLTIYGTGYNWNQIINDYSYYSQEATKLIIEDGVPSIGYFAFNGFTGLQEVTIPNTAESIGGYAFQSCNNLSEIIIPASVKSIGDLAFASTGLQKIVFKGDAPYFVGGSMGSKSQFYGVNAEAYYPAANETWTEDVKQDYQGNIVWIGYEGDPDIPVYSGTLRIPAGIAAIESQAFADLPQGNNVIIPDSVVSIADDAFENSKVVIVGSSDSYAEQYANKNNLPFKTEG